MFLLDKGELGMINHRNLLGQSLLNEDDIIKQRIDLKFPKFEYVGGYTGSDGYLYLMCKDCGVIVKHNAQITKPSRRVSLSCINCINIIEDADKTRNQYKKYDRVICVSEECNNTYQKYFSDCAPSQVLYNVIDDEEILKKAEMEPAVPVNKTKLTAIAVGRMSPEKNYAMLLEVHKQLIEEGFDYELWLVGDGKEANALKEYVKLQHLENSVKFFGFQTNPYPFMKRADFLVCSSKYEGYSTVVVEAMILGTPVITVDCGGMRQILGNNEYGIITENNESALYAGIAEYLNNTKLRSDYSCRAIHKGKQFTIIGAVKQSTDMFIQIAEEACK